MQALTGRSNGEAFHLNLYGNSLFTGDNIKVLRRVTVRLFPKAQTLAEDPPCFLPVVVGVKFAEFESGTIASFVDVDAVLRRLCNEGRGRHVEAIFSRFDCLRCRLSRPLSALTSLLDRFVD